MLLYRCIGEAPLRINQISKHHKIHPSLAKQCFPVVGEVGIIVLPVRSLPANISSNQQQQSWAFLKELLTKIVDGQTIL